MAGSLQPVGAAPYQVTTVQVARVVFQAVLAQTPGQPGIRVVARRSQRHGGNPNPGRTRLHWVTVTNWQAMSAQALSH